MQHSHPQRNCARQTRRYLWLVGLASLAWLLLRSGLNPRRLSYPCQRAALANSIALLATVLPAPLLVALRRRLRDRFTVLPLASFAAIVLIAYSLSGGHVALSPAGVAARALPAWTSPSAVSSVFAVTDVPVPDAGCSLDGGDLPVQPACDEPAEAFADPGVDALVAAMEQHASPFFETPSAPAGVVGSDDVVVIKINNQWGAQGDGDGVGRMSTNADVLKGLIWRILQHPEGFSGEIVVAENTQGANANWDTTPANAQDQNQSYLDVATAYQSQGYPVSLSTWDDLAGRLVSGGAVDAPGYPAGEYAGGDADDAYILLEDAAASGAEELSYPKFRTAQGTAVSMRYGVYAGGAYHADRLTLINMPVLKKHGMAASTIAWKNLIGFVTIADEGRRYGDWDTMHDFYWGYTAGANREYGLLGREMALIRAPDLNLVDAIWVAVDDNTGGNAVRQDVIVASTDPFAVDWYSSEYLLRSLVSWDGQDSSAARAGRFRSATRVNQNAAQAVWPGGAYPYMDLLDSYDGDTVSSAEANQMNAYVVSAATGATATPTATLPPGDPTATPTETATETPTSEATPTETPAEGDITIVFQDGSAPDPGYAGTTDVILSSDATQNSNVGGLGNVECMYSVDLTRNTLIRFDLAALPPGATVVSALLEVYRSGGDAPGASTISVNPLTRSWAEGTGTDFWPEPGYVPDGANWWAASTGVDWTTTGGDFDQTTDFGLGPNGVISTADLPAAVGDQWVSFELTAIVQRWVDTTTVNDGVLLRGTAADDYAVHYFASREADSAGDRPRLTVVYRPGEGPQVPVSPGVAAIVLALAVSAGGLRRRACG